MRGLAGLMTFAFLAGPWPAAPASAAQATPAQPVSATAATAKPLPQGRTVRQALRRAQRAGRISLVAHDVYRGWYREARVVESGLKGPRRVQLTAVLGQLRSMARDGSLTADRLPLAMLTLHRNTRFWKGWPYPLAGSRVTFGRDPVIFQFYPGHGLQVQHLASFGKANALASACQARKAGRPSRHGCRPAALRRLLDRMLDLSARRSGRLVWESWFRFGGARPGWISAMTQGTAAQAFGRGGTALDSARYLLASTSATRAFERPPPAGVAVPASGGRHYLMYSTLPGLRILNGHLQAITGLRAAAALTQDQRAWRAFARGDGAARVALASYDTGAWSLYSASGREANLGYHRLVQGFLSNLCGRTRADAYCSAEARFARYLREPPRVRLGATPRRVRSRRPATVRFTLSKVSEVRVAVTGPRGVVMHRSARMTRGSHALRWRPPARGRYRVTVHATGLSGPRGAASRYVVARTPVKQPRKKN